MGTSTSYVNQTTTNLPAYAEPYYRELMERAQANLTQGYRPYQDAAGNPIQRIADFTDEQRKVQQDILNQRTPGQFGAGSQLAAASGLGALNAGQYTPGQFNAQQIGQPNLNQYSMQGPANVQGMSQSAPMMGAAQTNYNPSLNYFQMQQPRDVQGNNVQAKDMQAAQTDYNPSLNYYQMSGPGTFGSTQAQSFMSPYMQNVVDVQKNEAVRDAQKGQLAQNLGSSRQGTYGGARQLLAQTENQRNLGTQLGNIQAQGSQQAFQNAQQQFNTEQGLQQQAGQQNLAANLGVQQLGTQTNTQTALANLSNEQQSRVNNQAQQFQAQGMNAQQALQAALANQQAALTTGQQNLSANLQTQGLQTQTGLQTALANLSSQQQANVQNQAAQLQTQGLNAQQAMQAALANQQMGFNTGQQNLNAALQTQQLGTQTGLQAMMANQQYNMQGQQLGEQSRQFGAQQRLAGLQQANQSAQTLGNIGAAQQQGDLARFGMQQGTAAQQQALQQQTMSQQYQDFLNQRDYYGQQLQQYSNLLQGVPVQPNQTSTQTAPTPGLASQLVGAGLGAASIYNTFKG